MKKHLAAITLLLAVFTTGITLADSDVWDKGSAYNQLFNPQTVETLEGEVLGIDRGVEIESGMDPAVVVTVKTEKGPLSVHIGPNWFTEPYRDEWNIQPGDKVVVTGSLVTIEGSNAMLLSAGQKGDKSMVVRDDEGIPMWDPEQTTTSIW